MTLPRLLAGFLHEQGYAVEFAHDGESGLARALAGGWDLILLDGMLPRLDGFEVLRRLRQRDTAVPVLMLTARAGESDLVTGLDHGADDYVAKTASPRELGARIRALLRRPAAASTAAAPAPSPLLQSGELRIDPEARRARLRGQEVALTPVEFDLLAALARQPDKVLTRAQLVEQLRDRRYEASDRSVDVHVTALRRKLGDDPREPRYIRTVRNAGYLLQKLPVASDP